MQYKSYAVKRIFLNADDFDDIIQTQAKVIQIVDDLKPYIEDMTWVHEDNRKIFYNKTNETALIYYNILIGMHLYPVIQGYMKRCIIVRSETHVENDVYEQPLPNACVKYVTKILYSVGYTDETIKEALDSHSIDYHVSPFHKEDPWAAGTPVDYGANQIHCWDDCVYYDINNAHMDALCEIFPKAKGKFLALRRKINKLKAEGKPNEARKLKDFINLYCGMLGLTKKDENGKVVKVADTRGTYEWIVQRTRDILLRAIEFCGGKVLYANTDGCIIHAPERVLETSDRLGQFKSELCDSCGKVYYFQHHSPDKSTTNYRIYQFTNSKGKKEFKGTAPIKVRSNIDLSEGKIVTYKQYEEYGCRYCKDIKQDTREIIHHDRKQEKECKRIIHF